VPLHAVATLAFQLRGSLITVSSSRAKISRPSLMLATGITFSVRPPAL